MNKALMIAMQPQHVVNVLNGDKDRELRTWIPKDYVGWVYVYVTKCKPYLVDFREESMMEQKYELFHNKKNVLGILKNKVVNGLVAFRFWFDEYEEITLDDNLEICTNETTHEALLTQSCVDYNNLNNYFMNENGDVFGYAWHIKKLEIFDDPKELSEFYKRIDGLDENGSFILGNLKDGEFVTIPELKKKYLLSKPPQRSVWVYV